MKEIRNNSQMSDIKSKIETLAGILSRYFDRLIDKAAARSQKLSEILASAGDCEGLEGRIYEIRQVKRAIDVLSAHVSTSAIPNILIKYAENLQGPASAQIRPPIQITVFLMRLKELDKTLAAEIATFLAKEYGTLTPLTIIDVLAPEEYAKIVSSSFDYGGRQVELAEAVDALDHSFEDTDGINMRTARELLHCIYASNKVSKDVFSNDACYQRFLDVKEEYSVDESWWVLPLADDGYPLQDPLVFANRIADIYAAKPADMREVLAPFMRNIPKRGSGAYGYVEPQNGEYFPGLKERYQVSAIAKGVADIVIKYKLILNDERQLFLYKFFGYGHCAPGQKVHWNDHSKADGGVGHPTELYYLLWRLFAGGIHFSTKLVTSIVAVTPETRELIAGAEDKIAQLGKRAPTGFRQELNEVLGIK